MTYGQHLHRSRHGILYFRYVIPRDLRIEFGRSELRVSLGTSGKRQAEPLADELKILMRRAINRMRESRRMGNGDQPNATALRELINRRQIDVLRKELEGVDGALAEKTREVDALKEKLLATLDMPAGGRPTTAIAPRLSEAIGAFKAERKAQNAWTAKTAAMWDSRLALLSQWFGDVPVSAISRAGMVEFFSALQRLPKNAAKYPALKGKSMPELVGVTGFDPISSSTVNQIMECMSALFGWMDSDRVRWCVAGNVARGLSLAKARGIERLPFTDSDLTLLLSTPEWKAKKFNLSYCYWLIPLGLYVGARINELCQLELTDFRDEDGTPVISLCTEGLRGKNANARRLVPIHPELLRLGLLRHVERMREAGQTRLFPECIEKRDGHAQDASRWFGRFRERAGLSDKRKVFHSFRHGFVSQLLNAGVDETTGVAPLVGHAGSGEASSTYWNVKDVKRLEGIVAMIRYPVAEALIPPVESVEFAHDPLQIASGSRQSKAIR